MADSPIPIAPQREDTVEQINEPGEITQAETPSPNPPKPQNHTTKSSDYSEDVEENEPKETSTPAQNHPAASSTKDNQPSEAKEDFVGGFSNTRKFEAQPQKTALFRQAKISIAIDVSGSTFGQWLESEVKAIRSICSLFPSTSRSSIKILPWSDVAHYPIGLNDLDDLDSDGGTDPSVLLHDDSCRYELQNSSFWFIMTDGDILEKEVRTFAQNLVEYGLHGLASVVAIFGERESTPSKCNVSVGLSVFAVSPHCAFLYTDVETGHTYILQTKGCFSALLPKGASNPIFTASTQWSDLPRTSYENLARVPIPPPQSVSREEVVLKDNTRINLNTLFGQENVDIETANKILEHEDNMKTIALTAKLKGQSEQFRSWLDSVDKIIVDAANPDNIARPRREDDLDLVTESMSSLMAAADKPRESVVDVQRKLREANERDMQALSHEILEVRHSSNSVSWGSTHARKISTSNFVSADDNIGSAYYSPHHSAFELDPVPAPSAGAHPVSNYKTQRGTGQSGVPRVYERVAESELHNRSLMNPGFGKPEFQRDFHKGECMLCASTEGVMALLLKRPSLSTAPATANFPAPGSLSQLQYPLTMGNYPETDIIAPLLACDPCSYRIVQKGKLPSGDEIEAALPLVSYAKNRAAWLETINLGTQKRFSIGDLPLVFLAIMYTKLERLLGDGESKMAHALQPALNWACGMLLQEVELKDPSSSRSISLSSNLLRMFRGALGNVDEVELLQYPMDGVVTANVALSNSLHKNRINASKREQLIFHRFAFHLTTQFLKLRSEAGEIVSQAAMVLILILDERPGPRSLLTIEALRQISVHFKNRQEMMLALQKSLNWRPRKAKAKRLSISVKDLLETPLLDPKALKDFRRLGALFSWIEDKAAHAIAAFLHCLHCTESTATDPAQLFTELRKRPGLQEAMSNADEVSAKKVEELISVFPPIL